jgi:hypothetical protein
MQGRWKQPLDFRLRIPHVYPDLHDLQAAWDQQDMVVNRCSALCHHTKLAHGSLRVVRFSSRELDVRNVGVW